jgi:predicted permease
MANLSTLFDQTRQVVRRLLRTPLFTTLTLVTLTVGIGATVVIFSVVEGILLKPLPYAEPDRLIGIQYTANILPHPLDSAPFLNFIDREQSKTLEDIGAFTDDGGTITGMGDPEHVYAQDVTASTFSTLRVTPAVGRLFSSADDTAGAPETVVLSHAFWQKKFGADPSAIGRNMTLDGRPRQIIGVLPAGFNFLDHDDPSVFLPFQWDRNKTKLGNFSYETVARLKPGVTMEQATADLTRLVPIAVHSFAPPEGYSVKLFENANFVPVLKPLKQSIVGDIGSVLWVLMGSIVMVLLIACANVANLLLVRVEGRRQELAIRAALGAGWRRIAEDLLVESLVLGVAGSALGLAVAYAALRGLVALAPAGLPRISEIGIDLPVVAFTVGIALFTSLLIGVIPVMRYAGSKASAGLREGGRGQSQSRDQHRTRNGLVVLQIALALMLLICSGLMIRTFDALMHVNPGFEKPETVQTFRLGIPESDVKTDDQVMRTEQEMRDRVAAISGVTSVAIASGLPLDGSTSNDLIYAQDRAYAEGELPPLRRFRWVSPGYFATMGTRMIAGRDFTWNDNYQKLPVTIISESFAREYWHDAAGALGKRIRASATEPWREIVGVVQDTHDDGVSRPATTMAYWPLLMGKFDTQEARSQRFMTMVIRTDRAGTESFMTEARRAVWSVDGNLPLSNARTLGVLYKQSMARTSFTLVMLSVAGAMALLLGSVGIYGVISYAVTQRTREIGIRMALGAQRQSITSMFVRQGLVLTAIGVVVGLGVSFGAMRLMSSLLFNVSPSDPITYGTITVAIAIIASLACYLPSRRAASVDPVHALRSE